MAEFEDKLRTFDNAVERCAVREIIYRASNPQKGYGKNHDIPLHKRVPLEDQQATDWKIRDPEGDACWLRG